MALTEHRIDEEAHAGVPHAIGVDQREVRHRDPQQAGREGRCAIEALGRRIEEAQLPERLEPRRLIRWEVRRDHGDRQVRGNRVPVTGTL